MKSHRNYVDYSWYSIGLIRLSSEMHNISFILNVIHNFHAVSVKFTIAILWFLMQYTIWYIRCHKKHIMDIMFLHHEFVIRTFNGIICALWRIAGYVLFRFFTIRDEFMSFNEVDRIMIFTFSILKIRYNKDNDFLSNICHKGALCFWWIICHHIANTIQWILFY